MVDGPSVRRGGFSRRSAVHRAAFHAASILPMIQSPPMKHPARKAFAVLAIVAGAVVLIFEAAAASRTSSGEMWFWSAIAALTILLGLAEFIWPGEKK